MCRIAARPFVRILAIFFEVGCERPDAEGGEEIMWALVLVPYIGYFVEILMADSDYPSALISHSNI
jgi:hypothetical protein